MSQLTKLLIEFCTDQCQLDFKSRGSKRKAKFWPWYWFLALEYLMVGNLFSSYALLRYIQLTFRKRHPSWWISTLAPTVFLHCVRLAFVCSALSNSISMQKKNHYKTPNEAQINEMKTNEWKKEKEEEAEKSTKFACNEIYNGTIHIDRCGRLCNQPLIDMCCILHYSLLNCRIYQLI